MTMKAVMGTIYGFAAAFFIGFWDVRAGGPALSWQWIIIVSLIVDLAVGIPLSLLPTRGKSSLTQIIYGLIASIPLVVFTLIVTT